MKKNIEIWSEGYRASGDSSTAIFIGQFMAESFDEAVELYNKNRNKHYTMEAKKHADGHWSIYACRLFDNELEARKSFG